MRVRKVLWSDPTESDDFMRRGVHPSCRDAGGAGAPNPIAEFGADCTEHFCALNRLSVVVRSHQAAPARRRHPSAHSRIATLLKHKYESGGFCGWRLFNFIWAV